MKKRILSLFLAFVMVVGLLPVGTLATNGASDTVYLSVSFDGRYIDDKNGSPMAYVPVSMDALTAVDLDEYGLSEYLYDENGDGTYEITALHLMIYAHEMLYGGDWSEVTFTGAPGSSYFAGGVFGFDENLNYYLNGQYPLVGEGWGATSDQIVLEAGDYLDVASFSGWDFYADSNYGFHFFADGNGDFTHHYHVEAGRDLSVKLVRSYSGMGSGATIFDEAGYTVFYGASLYNASGTVTTDDRGCASIPFTEAGTYYLWADGGYGCEYPGSIVSAPAYAKVTVTAPACEHTWADATCTVPKTCTNCGETEGEPAGHTWKDATCTEPETCAICGATEGEPAGHSFVNGACKDCGIADPDIQPPVPTWQEGMAKTQAYLTDQAERKAPIVGSTDGEWLVLGLARAGVSADRTFFDGYYENVLNYVKENIDPATGRLHSSKSTDNARVILALTALGKDVTNVGGHNLLQGLSDQDFVKKQGVNGPVWALIALDSHGYDIPANADTSKQVTRQWLVNYILENQLPDGGWKIQGQAPDDMTPMAVQALAPYYNTNPAVKTAVDKAMTIMEDMAEKSSSTETLAQIVVAHSAMGLDSEAVVNKMLASALDDGGFKKGPSERIVNQMSTEQAFYALVAYDRFKNDDDFLYNMTNVVIEKVEPPMEEPIPVTGITLNKTSLTLEVGKTELLTATVTPGNAADKTVTWSSSNPSVAAVSAQGSVTAVAEGTTSISAKAGDVTAVCVVTVTAQEVGLDFGLTESQIKGYVTVSFEDFGKRVSGESMDAIYKQPLGTIIPATQVPYTRNDTIASVTLRLLDAMDYTSSYQGTMTNGFYLESIGGFTHKGTYYPSFGEFDAGVGSGWMITWNNWFIDQGASEFTVKNGDVIRWQYTCQLGADIGEDMSGEVYGVKALIDAIGTVTKDSGPAIQAARAAYDKLTNPQKALVTNYNKLTAAEKAYADLLAQEEIPDETAHPFSDTIGHWAEEAITYVYEKGLMTGTKADRFSPETELSRAMLVTILYRMEGEPAVTVDNTFSDVKDGTWYTDAVIWAAEKGIVNGVGKHRFAPDQDITREQMATMFLRYSDYKDYDTAQRNDLSGYADANSISSWALEALQWANGEGLITGRKATILAPQGDTTRAETAAILVRYLETIL